MFDKHRDKKSDISRMNEPDTNQSAVAAPTPPLASAKAAVIGPGIVIDGDISGSENLVIEGKVRGQVQLGSHEVTVGRSGEVNADIAAKIVRVAGKVKGDLSAKEKVIINSTGNVRGNIVTPRMLLEDGAIFKGSIDMDPGDAAVSSSARGPVKTASAPELVADNVKKNTDHALKSG